MQITFVQIEEMAPALSNAGPGRHKSLLLLSGQQALLARRSQTRALPAPAPAPRMASHTGPREHQPKARGQKNGQRDHCPADLPMPRTRRRLAGLCLHDLRRQRVLRWSAAARLVLQAADTVCAIAMQPRAHHVLPTGVHSGDLWHCVGAAGEQHHVRPGELPAPRLGGSPGAPPTVGPPSDVGGSFSFPPASLCCETHATLLYTCLALLWRDLC